MIQCCRKNELSDITKPTKIDFIINLHGILERWCSSKDVYNFDASVNQ